MGYESTGIVVRAEDGAGHFMNSAPSADTNYSLPATLTPGGTSGPGHHADLRQFLGCHQRDRPQRSAMATPTTWMTTAGPTGIR